MYIFWMIEFFYEDIKYGIGIYFIDLKVSKINCVNGIYIFVIKF